MKQIKSALILFAFFSISAASTEFDRNTLIDNSSPISFGSGGLLDPARFSVSHSYSMNFSSNSSGQSSTDGLYLSTLKYQFSVPVTLSLDMGYAHQPGMLFSKGQSLYQNQNSNFGAFVIPRLELNYKPFKNTLVRFQYLNSKGMNQNSPYLHRYGHEDLLLTPDRGY